MLIQLLSDVHVEFHGHPTRFFDNLLRQQTRRPEVLVLAGDIVPISKTYADLTLAAAARCANQVLLVLGNHDYYGASPVEVRAKLAMLQASIPNLWLLEQDAITIGTTTFAGATTWFSNCEQVQKLKASLNDYYQIKDFEPWVYQQHEAALQFWQDTATEADIWITHHLPSELCVAPHFKGDPLNCFFVSTGMQELIEQRQPSYLLCGHSHNSINAKIGNTQILSNPYGYEERSLNRSFSYEYFIEV